VPVTVVVAVALSSVSCVTFAAVTLAVLLSVPGFVVVTTIVTVALPLAPRLPRLQVTVPSLEELGGVQVPCVADAELKWALAGSGSVTVTPVAVCPPVLEAVIV
jgi:hypothetical protein